jgi:hypothetical protein
LTNTFAKHVSILALVNFASQQLVIFKGTGQLHAASTGQLHPPLGTLVNFSKMGACKGGVLIACLASCS